MQPAQVYESILTYFNVYHDKDYMPTTRSYVDMDSIHDAILLNGVDMQDTVRHYVIKAKQVAIDNHRTRVRQYALSREKLPVSTDTGFNENVLDNYGFSELEKTLIKELLSGVKAYQSSIGRRRYERIIENIKRKVRLHYEPGTIV